MLRKTRAAALALVLASPAAVTACGGCGYTLSVAPVTARGSDLSLTARLTGDGPVEGVKIEFSALGPDGVVLGTVPTGADGVAKLESRNSIGPDSVNGRAVTGWTEYRAKVWYLQDSDRAADAVCAEPATASFRYEPS
ncbi:hypothetical protein [Lentzea nigeriaca]|uniref:hypothetical protein n=1 Tax=Lentzea nigeriaca TaxID=1128665 RepID=UPI0019591FF1|nr:hypothetical protein [Lentzea nigeriaca]MBM7856509.1 hypothetical protein [Lentzea nigeriaca]